MRSAIATNSMPREDPAVNSINSGNPVPLVANGLKRWVHLSYFRKLLDQGAGSLGPLKATVTELAECIRVCEDIIDGKKEYEALKDELEKTFEILNHHYGMVASPAITASVESLWKGIDCELQVIKGKLSRDRLERFKDASDDLDDVFKCYDRVRDLLQRVSLNADISTWKIVDELATEHRLDRLQPAMSACYNSTQAVVVKRGPCTEGTRINVIQQIAAWVNTSDHGSLHWMNGMAGTGKTTISYSLCEQLEAMGKLAASFFCTRLLPECRNVNKIIPSIAYQLASFSRPFRCALSDSLVKNRDAHTRRLDLQFDALIVQPLLNAQNVLYNPHTVKDTLPENLVVVIDALDECEDKKSTREILSLLLVSTNLPVKFIVSSRPEPQIRDHMTKQSVQTGSRVVLHELDTWTVSDDIETYLRSELAEMRLNEDEIAALVERAGVLFIHAATLVRYISYDNFSGNSRSRLDNILNSSIAGKKDKEIDELYTTVLAGVFDNPELEAAEKDNITRVLHTIICAKEPLTVDALSRLLQMNDADQVRTALRPLWSILHISGVDELVATLHASFAEYMLDPLRSKEYYCNPAVPNQILALGCFDCFRQVRPQFNICGLESSFIPDYKIPELYERVKKVVTTEIFYAAQYWAVHLHSATESPELIDELEEFMSRRLLLWMEVMNLNWRTKDIPEAIYLAQKWDASIPEDLKSLIRDAGWFAMTFASSSVSRSTPHIYTSMFAFWPKHKPMSRCYAKWIWGVTKVSGTRTNERQIALREIWYFDRYVYSPSFSPDGTQIAVAVGSRIHLLSPLTGERIIAPLEGHSSGILSLQFSSDGTRLVSGSADETTRVWCTQTGKTLLGPLKGHTGYICSVSFSPDRSRIISGSTDRTMCIWDVSSGRLLFGPLRGLGDGIFGRTFKYSPDGRFIIYIGRKSNLVVLDAENGQVLRTLGQNASDDPFHTLDISPNGKYVAAVSSDWCIHAWDIQTWKPVLGQLANASRFFDAASVSFSPDGCWIASGSRDGAICLWDARTGDLVLGSLDGHAGLIGSLSFSPDGAFIISSSSDRTLRLWDVRSILTAPDLPHGHAARATSISTSHSGTRIVSCSKDATICVWDAESGEMIESIPEKTLARVQWPILEERNEADNIELLRAEFLPESTHILVNTSHGPYIFVASRSSIRSLFSDHLPPSQLLPLVVVLGFVILSMLFVGSYHAYNPSSTSKLEATTRMAGYAHALPIRLFGLVTDALGMDLGSQTPVNPVNGLITQVAFLLAFGLYAIGDGMFALVGIFAPNTSCAAFSPDGTRIVTGSADGIIRVQDANTNQAALVINLPFADEDSRRLRSVSFSSDGRRIFSQSGKRKLQMHCANSGELLADLNDPEWSEANGFSPDGTRILIQRRDSISLVGLRPRETWRPIAKMTRSQGRWELNEWKRMCTFTADGSRIAMDMGNGSIGIWSTQTNESSIDHFQVGIRSFTSMTFCPDGTHLITGLEDGTICIIDTRPKPATSPGNIPDNSDWILDDEGWVVDEQSRPLVWVPLELRLGLKRPRTTRQISRKGCIQLDFEGVYLGESWTKCYQPE